MLKAKAPDVEFHDRFVKLILSELPNSSLITPSAFSGLCIYVMKTMGYSCFPDYDITAAKSYVMEHMLQLHAEVSHKLK